MLFRRKPPVEAPILHAFDDDFDDVVSVPGITLVDFWAPWCAPCKMMEPILAEVSLEYQDRGVRVVKVNVDEAQRTAADFSVRSIPTLMFFRGGEPLFEMVGMVPKPVLERELTTLLAGGGGVPEDDEE